RTIMKRIHFANIPHAVAGCFKPSQSHLPPTPDFLAGSRPTWVRRLAIAALSLVPLAVVAHPVSKYTVTVDSIRVTNTRAFDDDPDCITLVGKGNEADPRAVTKNLGSIDNGTRKVDVTLEPFVVGRGNSKLNFNYLVVNSGTGGAGDVTESAANLTGAGLGLF